MTFREIAAEDNENKEIQFLQYDDLLQKITAIAGHMTTLTKSELENSFLLVFEAVDSEGKANSLSQSHTVSEYDLT